jgi:hypothetical protein
MVKHKRIVVAETKLPFTQKILRLYFDPSDLLTELKKKKSQQTGMHESENSILTQALYEYAKATLGEEEVKRCLKK